MKAMANTEFATKDFEMLILFNSSEAPAPFSFDLDIGTPEQKARADAVMKANHERFVAENGREPTADDIPTLIAQLTQRKPPRGGGT